MTEATIPAPITTCEPADVPADRPRLLPLGDLLDTWATDAEAAREALLAGRPRGPVTGIAGLDRELGGYLAPGLHVLHGEPGTGKTAFALQAAASCKTAALFVTTEMSALELLRRHTARVTETYLGRLRTGELSPADSLALARRAAGAAPMLAFLDGTRAYVPAQQADKGPASILETAQIWRERCESEHMLVVVDSLHSWTAAAPLAFGAEAEYERLSAAVVELQRLGAELGVPVLAVAERNRAMMGSTGQSAGAGTRRIEYGAESVLALQRDKEAGDWKPDAAGEYHVHVKVAKNRNGATGPKVPLRFCGPLQSFREV